MKEKYSYSKLSTYLQCPYKYKKQQLDKQKEKIRWQVALGITTADILERVYKDEKILMEGISENLLKDLISEYWIPNQYKKDYTIKRFPSVVYLGYKTVEEEDQQKENLLKWLQFYFKENPLKRVFGIEIPFEVQFDDFTLTGRIDKLDLINNKLSIIDNKVTSSFLNDLFESIQLGIYCYAVENILPRFQIDKIGYYYIKQSKSQLIDRKFLQDDIIYSNIRRAVKGIRDNEFSPCQNQFCNWCDFKKECKEK